MEGRLFNMGKEGACKIKKAPLMIKPSKPPPGGEGKTHNRPSPVGNAPLLPTAPPPEGEVLAALCLVMLMREMLLCDLLCPRLRGKGGAVRHQRGRAAEGSCFLFSFRAKGAVVWFYQKRRPLYSKGHPPQARRAHLTSGLRSDRLTACAVPPFLVLRTTFPPQCQSDV